MPGLPGPVRLAGFRLMEAGLEPKPDTEGWEEVRNSRVMVAHICPISIITYSSHCE